MNTLPMCRLAAFLWLITTYAGKAQSVSYELLSPLPEPISNNAVTAAAVDDNWYVYTFTGLAAGKDCADDHLRAYRYHVATDTWETLPDVPDPQGGKIAAAASTLGNTIYVVGGYHLGSGCAETSSAAIHRFDPAANEWLSDGAPLPIPIDDQVQGTWRDSLLYVISGWSNNGNVGAVQIYDPAADSWSMGTELPLSTRYRVFGGSGTIIGDTIYYVGGAAATQGFPMRAVYRKGVINSEAPTEITWTDADSPAARRYRSAAATYNGLPIWLGGSAVSYNFDGLAYDGSGGVAPLTDVCVGTPQNMLLTRVPDALPPVMDLRGAAALDDGTYILVGGLDSAQQVRDAVLRVQIDALTATARPEKDNPLELFPNPVRHQVYIALPPGSRLRVYDRHGKARWERLRDGRLSTADWAAGTYWLQAVLPDGSRQSGTLFVIR